MDCSQKIISAFNGKLSDNEINGIIGKLQKLKKDKPHLTEKDLLDRLLDDQKRFMLMEQRLLNSKVKSLEVERHIQYGAQKFGTNESVIKDSLLSIISDNGRFPRMSIESLTNSITHEYYNVFQSLEKRGFFQLFKDKESAPGFMREWAQGVFDLSHNRKPNFSNKLVEEAAHVMHGLNKKRLMDLQGESFDIEGLRGYIFSGFMKPEIVANTKMSEWVDDTINALNVDAQAKRWGIELESKGVPNKEFLEKLETVYRDILENRTGGNPDSPIDSLSKSMKDPDRLNKMISAHRELMYKDGASYADYYSKYAGRNMLDSIRRDIRNTARRVAASRTLGPVPEVTIEYAFKKANKLLTSKGLNPLDNSFKKDFREMLDISLGRAAYHENLLSRTVQASKKIAQNALLMKTALKAGLLDPTIAALNLSTIGGDNYYSAFAKYIGSYVNTVLSPSQRKDMAKHFDVIGSLIMDEFHTELNGNAFERGLTKLTAYSAKIAGIPYQTMSAKTATAYNASRNLYRILHGEASDSVNGIKRLERYGFSKDELEILKNYGVTDIKGNAIISGDFLRNRDAGDLRSALGNPTKEISEFTVDGKATVKEVPLTDMEILRKVRGISQKLGAYYNDHANMGSPTPTLVNHFQLTGGRTPDTWSGAALHLIMQFKAFAASVYRVHRHAAYSSGIKEENIFKQYVKGNNGAIGHAVLTSTIMGMGLLAIDDILNGKTPRDPTADPVKFITDAMIKGGTGGIVMDFALNDYEKGGRDFVADLAGPVPSMINDSFYIFSEMKRGLNPMERGDNKSLEMSARFLKKWMPMANFYGTQMLMNTDFADGLNEWIDPKYNYRRRKQMRENSGMLYRQTPLFGD